MRTISLSSRLQWAFRGTVLSGALATGDVDNDGVTQIEPEYDCWDEVERGEIPADALPGSDSCGGLRRQSTYTSVASNRESMSVEDILHMFDGSDGKAFTPSGAVDVGDSSDDELYGRQRASLQTSDVELAGHIKWEDALDIERDGRKPWVIAQRLGTISSVVVADISNSGHNSIVVVNGEGKCHVFDYPFKRRLHPDAEKRRRQRNHYRRFSQDRFFKDGVVTDIANYRIGAHSARSAPPDTSSGSDSDSDGGLFGQQPLAADPFNTGSLGQLQALRAKSGFPGTLASMASQQSYHDRTRSTSISTPAMRGLTSVIAQPELGYSQSTGALGLQRVATSGNTPGASAATISGGSRSGSVGARVASDAPVSKATWRPISSMDGQANESHASSYLLPAVDAASTSNVSSQADPPLTMLGGQAGRDGAVGPDCDGAADMRNGPESPLGSRRNMAGRQDKLGTDTDSARRRTEAHEAGMGTLGALFGDPDMDSDSGSIDGVSDSGEGAVLTLEEIGDIERIWGADVGKRSGDWFPYVLDRPDATFDIPTNVEHALVADIDDDGLNELILTSTDGFVHIFRVDLRVKHSVKPTITPLGAFSNIPTTLPSVNATGNGSPYLFMSAPRSPDASDADADDDRLKRQPVAHSSSGLGRETSGLNAHGEDPQASSHISSHDISLNVPDEPTSGPGSDLCLVNHLLRSIKDASAAQSEEGGVRGEMENGERQARETISHISHKASSSSNLPDSQSVSSIAPQASAQTILHAVTRRQSTGRRGSLTSRMRENFSYIVTGMETSRKPGPAINRTAPPSLNHSRVHTANNSGNSTNAHSRRPSLGDEAADMIHSALGSDYDGGPAYQTKAPSAAQTTPVVVTSDTRQQQQYRQRGRNNTICVGGLDTTDRLTALTDMVGGNLPSIKESSPAASASHPQSVAEPGSDTREGPSTRGGDSRVQSRRNSIIRAAGQKSHVHSRRSSASSAAGKLQPTNAAVGSGRGSIGSNISTCESSTHNNSGASQMAVPLPAAVSAQGRFSRPVQRPDNTEMAEDNASLISQITERLEDLNMKTKKKKKLADPPAAPSPAAVAVQRKSTDVLFGESHDEDPQLPPARTVVDWESSAADKVATWFLDNIPGNVSMVNAPADTFGEPLTSRRRIIYTGGSESSSSYSSCSCSLCASDDESSSSDSAPVSSARPVQSARPETHPAALGTGERSMRDLAPPRFKTASGPAIARSAAAYPGLDLPPPLDMNPSHNGEETNESEPEDDVQGTSPEQQPESASERQLASSPAALHGDERPQQFLLLSKPGGRFVPIDMVHGVILQTVEPPPVPLSFLTGNNAAHMMNVDVSASMNSLQASFVHTMPHGSGVDLTAMTGSYLYQSPSWQSNSAPWAQNLPSMSYGSAAPLAKSPAPMTDADVSQPGTGQKSAFVTVDSSIQQVQSPLGQDYVDSSESPASAGQAESVATRPEADMRKTAAGASYTSVFKPGPATGARSLSTNLRSRRSMHRTSFEFLRGQTSVSRHGPSPVYRGPISRSGAMTPVAGGYPIGPGQFDRRHLGFAGLRGYIGSNTGRQRADLGFMTSSRGEDGGAYGGFYTPMPMSSQVPGRPPNTGPVQGLSSGAMPREPGPGYFASVATTAPAQGTFDRSQRQNPRSSRHMPTTPAATSASPQRGQLAARYSPSMTGWSSYRDGGALSTIKDQDDSVPEDGDYLQAGQQRPHTAALAGRFMSDAASASPPNVQAAGTTAHEAAASVSGETPATADREYWTATELPSARPNSSLGMSAGAYHVPVDEKEEEIEEAPQPMEMDVTTYMVGGVTCGKRYRRISPALGGEEGACDDEVVSEDDTRELVSLVTMDGVITCYDPAQKVNHYVGLNLDDPALGIWKVKMHEEICSLSPLEAALRDSDIDLSDFADGKVLESTPAKRIYRRVGVSRRDLLDAVHYSSYIEDCVHMINKLETRRRRSSNSYTGRNGGRHKASNALYTRQVSYGTSSERPDGFGRCGKTPPLRTSRGNTLSKANRAGLSRCLRETMARNHRAGQTPRGVGTHVRDFAPSTQPSGGESSAALLTTPSVDVTDDDEGNHPVPETNTPHLSFSPSQRKASAGRAGMNLAQFRESGGELIDEQLAGPSGNSSLGNVDPVLLQKSIEQDISAARTGWYGRNRNDFRRNLRVADHLVVSTWRGATYFVDVGSLMDIAHYNELFTNRWNSSMAVASSENAPVFDKDAANSETQSCGLSTIYGHLSEFADVTGLVSRLRPNASVVRFKFQDTVSAFLADTFAPVTGGPNVPCIFYVDYKNRIWVYYHLDEIAEMNDVYGATWLRNEPNKLQTAESKVRAADRGIDFVNYDKPFSVVDMAHRRINMDPWIPLPGDSDSAGLYQDLAATSSINYPYSAKTWRRKSVAAARTGSAGGNVEEPEQQEEDEAPPPEQPTQPQQPSLARAAGESMSHASSENSANAFVQMRDNANVTGRYHTSYVPGPYLCPIWSDINSVDTYDVGACNLLELAMPELLAMKHAFCKALEINPDSIDEKTNLASVPGLANWVHSRLYCR
ncbi:hypothetical protein GGF46_003586 [Coemansia sp. RSA 552]|nr:hypothetical protein GGF46_003586 [Coemansia sp. RSA 552]